jgi:hypothetical protein
MCKGKPREQEVLIAGMLSKSHLLDLLKNYVIYEVINNKEIKKIAKHQQFRVVSKSVSRLKLEEDISDKGGESKFEDPVVHFSRFFLLSKISSAVEKSLASNPESISAFLAFVTMSSAICVSAPVNMPPSSMS